MGEVHPTVHVGDSEVPRLTAVACALAAVAGFAVLAVYGQPPAGLALAAGLLVGSVNGLLAARAVKLGVAFSLTSFMRIGLLSMVAIALGLLIQPATAWLTVIGVAASQFILTGVATFSVWRR